MTTTLNSSYINNPATVGQGGSGVASLTAYGLVAAGTTATAPYQSGGTGATNQIYVSGGAAALGTQTNNDAVGCWQLISTQTANNTASIAFTNLTTNFQAYKVLISQAVPITNATHLNIQMSSNGGSTYYNGATDYFRCIQIIADGSFNAVFNNNTTSIGTDYQGITTTNLNNIWEVTITSPDVSIANTNVTYIGKYNDNTRGTCCVAGGGRYNGTQAMNAIQFLMGSGNINTGIFNLYGLLV